MLAAVIIKRNLPVAVSSKQIIKEWAAATIKYMVQLKKTHQKKFSNLLEPASQSCSSEQQGLLESIGVPYIRF
jgi:hypothetical protein